MKSLATAGMFFHNQLLNPTGHYLSFNELALKFSVPNMMLIEAIPGFWKVCSSHASHQIDKDN